MKLYTLLFTILLHFNAIALTIDGFDAELLDSSISDVTVAITIPQNLEKHKSRYNSKNMLISQLGTNQLLLKINNESLLEMQDSLLSKKEIIKSWRKSLLFNYNLPEQTQKLKEVKIALIDSGFYRKDVLIPNFVLKQSNEINFHGTHVGGIILAVNPFIQLYSYDVAEKNDGSLTIENTINAVNDAIERKVDIINLSWGGTSFSQKELDAYKKAQNAGILIVVSAGNSGDILNTTKCTEYPACYKKELNNFIVVGNLSKRNHLNESSNYGPLVDYYFYGTNIKSLSANPSEDFSYMSGSSMSAPFITGLASQIIMNSKEKLSFSAIKSALKKNNLLSTSYNMPDTTNNHSIPDAVKELSLKDLQFIPPSSRINSNLD